MWTIVKDTSAQERALTLCKGCYQTNLILGRENLSGSTLSGKARDYGYRYKQSRKNLLKRLTENNVPWQEQVGDHNKRILVLG